MTMMMMEARGGEATSPENKAVDRGAQTPARKVTPSPPRASPLDLTTPRGGEAAPAMMMTPPSSVRRRSVVVRLWGGGGTSVITVAPKKTPHEGSFIRECCCCYASIEGSAYVECCNDFEPHAVCKQCVARFVATRLVEGNSTALKCFSTAGCRAPLSTVMLYEVLPEPLARQRDALLARADLAKARIPNLVRCPFCPYAFEADNEEEKVVDPPPRMLFPRSGGADDAYFHCAHPDCGRTSCRKCHAELVDEDEDDDGAPVITAHRCGDGKAKARKQYPGGATARRHRSAASATASVVRRCPGCDSHFVKEQGCNRMKCPFCAASVCYLCRKVITDANAYAHFCTCDCLVDKSGVIRRVGKTRREKCRACRKCSLWYVDEPRTQTAACAIQ